MIYTLITCVSPFSYIPFPNAAWVETNFQQTSRLWSWTCIRNSRNDFWCGTSKHGLEETRNLDKPWKIHVIHMLHIRLIWFMWFMWFIISRIQISCIPPNLASQQMPHVNILTLHLLVLPEPQWRQHRLEQLRFSHRFSQASGTNNGNSQIDTSSIHNLNVAKKHTLKKKTDFWFQWEFFHAPAAASSFFASWFGEILPQLSSVFAHIWEPFLLTSESPARCAYTGGAEHTSPGLEISCIKSWAQHNGKSEMLPTAAHCMSYCFDFCCTCTTLNKFHTAWIQHLRVYIDIVGTKW